MTPLGELRQEMDRLFDTFMQGPLASLSGTFGPRGWMPAFDMAETQSQIVVRAEVPGIDPAQLEITVVGNRLTVAGEKKETVQSEQPDCHLSESRYGAFRRTIELPSDVDPNQVRAQAAHGVVTITLEKTLAAAARRIDVQTG